MSTQTPNTPAFEFDRVSGLVWPASMDKPAAGMSREAFEYANRAPTAEECARGRLFAAGASAFTRAGRELGIDAATLAESIDLAALIRAAQLTAQFQDEAEGSTLRHALRSLYAALPAVFPEPAP